MSANTRAPSTIVTITLTGQTEFNIPFEYLARKYVEVTLLGIDRLPLVLNTDYRFVNKTLISLTRPYGAEYKQIELRRVTSATERLVDFHDGSILRAYDLNLSQIQTLHVAEEARDLTADTIGVNDEGHLDARGRKIVNLADAENGNDAVNLGQVISWNDSAYNSMIRAENAAVNAEAANTSAHTAKDAASISAQQAEANKNVTQADAAITTQNAVATAADKVAVTDMLAKVEAASGPSVELVGKVDKALGDSATALSTANSAASNVTQIADTKLDKAGGTITGNLYVDGGVSAGTFELRGGGAITNEGGYIHLRSDSFVFSTPREASVVGSNMYWNGDWYKHDPSKPSSYILMDARERGPLLYHSPAGTVSPKAERHKLFSSLTPPTEGWREIYRGDWGVGMHADLGIDLRGKTVLIEVYDPGNIGTVTQINAFNEGYHRNMLMYGSWGYVMEWVSQSEIRMVATINNPGSNIKAIYVRTFS